MSDRRVLVVADHEDVGARAAARAASSSLGSDGRVLVLTGADLAAARWRHEVTAYGVASTVLRVPGVGELIDDDLAGVLFRSCAPLVPPGLRHATEHDRGYAASELTALTTSWLLSLGPRVMNAVEGTSPGGPTRVPGWWLRLAVDSGFAVNADHPERRLLVAGSRVAGAHDDTERARALDLSERSGCRLLEVSLTGAGLVTAVTCVPSLLDPAHVATLAAALVDLARNPREAAA